MASALAAGTNPMEFKKKLAKTITEMYHSAADASQAEAHFEKTVQNKEMPDDVPTITFVSDKAPLLEVLQDCLPSESKSNLRRLVEQRAVELLPAGEKPSDPLAKINLTQVEAVRIGKRRYFRIIVKK
jgi:tyrosyl-tRNA synthetase